MWAHGSAGSVPDGEHGCGLYLQPAANIEVKELSASEFRVRVIEGRSESPHGVILRSDDHQRLAGGKAEPEELVRRSFEFLLEREPRVRAVLAARSKQGVHSRAI
jgi:hypothetical protein